MTEEVWNTSPLALVLGGPSIMVCPDCGEPLCATMAWTRCEWYCLDCGKPMGFLVGRREDETPELAERAKERQTEYDRHAGALIPAGRESYLAGTPQEDAHNAALVWLGQRARTKVR